MYSLLVLYTLVPIPLFTHVLVSFQEEGDQPQPPHTQSQRVQEEWMLICQRTAELQPDSS